MAEERETERIWATISKERYEQLREWADELGIQFSQYIALVAWMGASQLRRTLHPEQYIAPEVMADAIAKMTAQTFTPEVMQSAMVQAALALIEKLPEGAIDVGKVASIASGNDEYSKWNSPVWFKKDEGDKGSSEEKTEPNSWVKPTWNLRDER